MSGIGGALARRGLGMLGVGATAMALMAAPAYAGLIQTGATVQATYYNGSTTAAEAQIDSVSNTATASLATSSANFHQGSISASVVRVTNTQIIVTDNAGSGTPYCSSGAQGASCADVISGFDFLFAGENILGVSVDALSATTMLPVTATYGANVHNGLQLLSNHEILVDLTGTLPSGTGPQLILDVTTAAPPTGAPEPASLALLGAGMLGLLVARRRPQARG